MKLTCYALRPDAPAIRAAPATRPWMDAVLDHHAYRCLPLTIANSHGWEILAPFAFTATWTGDVRPEALTLRGSNGAPPPVNFVASHFGYGVITFHLWYLFRTEPGWDLFASGSVNEPKDGVAPLTGVIETDWLPYPFTMNWRMTRPGSVEFRQDEPICMIFPVVRGTLQDVEPEIVDIGTAPEVEAAMRHWAQRRAEFAGELYNEPRALKDAWQRDYFVGRTPDGAPVERHLSRLRLR
jgi:hypothetical protein